ncbi:MAG: hypothetical protein KF718_13410 [Polyangiaceae bacterium]|nr:hypothetical protein [Polyangiaceae bacterium]
MRRTDLEHLIRACADIADDDEIIVIGSQAVLGTFPHPPAELTVSSEADVYPKNHPERWEVIDGAIGEGSPFHDTFGYYAQGVEEGTASLPAGWQARLVPLRNENTRGATGLCLEVHDLCLSKYVANREKDRRYVRAAALHGLVSRETLLERLPTLPIEASLRDHIRALIALDFTPE